VPSDNRLRGRDAREVGRRDRVVLALSVSVLSGCLIMVPGHLYPVQGPLSTLPPAPIYAVVINGVGNSGTVSTTLGTRPLTGSWSVLRPDDPSANSMAAEWDRVYGNGFFTANVLGTPLLARGALAGKSDPTLTCSSSMFPEMRLRMRAGWHPTMLGTSTSSRSNRSGGLGTRPGQSARSSPLVTQRSPN
jgi:hypothetical protein